MTILKCKMCGGQLDIIDDETVVTCEYCGSKQTIPSVDDDKKLKLYERANKLRFNCDFDKAATVYENIISEFSDEAEAYWGMILCTYGIEYVDDPATDKKVPTCHRSSFDSVMDDPNFEMVMENADSVALPLYRQQAKEIEEIRKGIIEVSGKEQPYDIFICYKETAEDGERTLDSVLAQDVYDALTDKGYRVFFSRITLEDKLGVEYEPYIFAALNSAKVMLAFGTSYQYYNAVWVKNEWSRYLKLMAKDKTKHLIPCFKNLDAYDIPKEFAKLQAQDLGKVGAVQDLIRGIEKLIPLGKTGEAKETVIIQHAAGNPTSDSLLKRVSMFLEDKEWNSANEYCEKVLDFDPENAQAYLGKLMAELQISKQESLKDHKLPFDEKNNYKKALRFGSEQLKTLLEDSIRYINDRNENERKEGFYTEAKKRMSIGTSTSYQKAADLFKSISDYKDSKELAEKCIELKDNIKNIKQKVTNFMNDLKNAKTFANEKSKQLKELSDEISKLNEKIEKLTPLSLILGNTLQEISETNNNILKNKERIGELKNVRSSLGIFAGKQKKEIDSEIALLDAELISLEANLPVLQEKTKGYSSVENLTSDLNTVSQKIEELNKQKLELEAKPVKTEEELISELMQTEEGKLVVVQYQKILENKKKYQVGKYVSFGNYADEKIEWKVLSVREDKALLITKEAIDCKKYNEKNEDVTWEACTLRKWLNNEFISQTFDEDEKEKILTTRVEPHKNPSFITKQGNATQDKVFLLSIQEAKQYFKNDDERCCKPSNTARSKRVYLGDNGNCWWWLRSSGCGQHLAIDISNSGFVSEIGRVVYNGDCGVRPALWINLNS